MNLAVLDLETNGLTGTSVLSASSLVFTEEGRILDFFHRYYLPMETPDPGALKVHGLTPARITWLRHGYEHPAFFADDWESLTLFWKSNHVDRICVHNLSFDISFIPYEGIKDFNWWCSMIGLTGYCAITGRMGKPKWPRLAEAKNIIFEKMTPPTEVLENEKEIGFQICHNSLSDCIDLYGILARVMKNRPEIIDFRPVNNRFIFKTSGTFYPSTETCNPDL
ncbi:MAG TPA: hypothetical protein PLV56_09050, partial [Synergistales bacterium]|nr:hypothetical protein [Synergistales bacterium]